MLAMVCLPISQPFFCTHFFYDPKRPQASTPTWGLACVSTFQPGEEAHMVQIANCTPLVYVKLGQWLHSHKMTLTLKVKQPVWQKPMDQ